MTPISRNEVPPSLESDESIIDSTGIYVRYKRLIEELNRFFDINPFGRKMVKINIEKVENLNEKFKYCLLKIKKVEYYGPFAFVTVMSGSAMHSMIASSVAEAIRGSLTHTFPQERYTNQANLDIISPQGITKPDAQFYPSARPARSLLPTVVVEVGVSESEIEMLRYVSDWFTIQEGKFVIEAAVVVKIKVGPRNGVEGPGLFSKLFTGAIFESYLRVVRADVTQDGRQEGWRELVKRETMESTVVLDGDDDIALDADPLSIKFSVVVNRGGHDQAITVPANLVNPDAQNDEDVVLLTEDDIIQISKDVFLAHEVQVAEARAGW